MGSLNYLEAYREAPQRLSFFSEIMVSRVMPLRYENAQTGDHFMSHTMAKLMMIVVLLVGLASFCRKTPNAMSDHGFALFY